jgi:hypothetical protein
MRMTALRMQRICVPILSSSSKMFSRVREESKGGNSAVEVMSTLSRVDVLLQSRLKK